jgi:hypothetical protein
VLGFAYGLLARLLAGAGRGGDLFGVMTLAFVTFVPMVLGFLTVRVHPQPSWPYRLFAPWLPGSAMLLACMALGLEGAVCILMGLPFVYIFGTVGGVLGGWRALRGRGPSVAVAILPLVIGPIEHRVPAADDLQRVETSIMIHAPAAAVWAQVVEVPTIRAGETRPALFTQLGFPRPLNATLDHPGIGGRRYARFEHGVLFIETITHWEPERHLRFTIDAQTDSIPPTTLDEHVTIGGPYFDVLTGDYRLEPLADGTVRLHLTSELRLSTHFNLYAQPWVDAIMRSIQRNILEVLKARAERGAGAGAWEPRADPRAQPRRRPHSAHARLLQRREPGSPEPNTTCAAAHPILHRMIGSAYGRATTLLRNRPGRNAGRPRPARQGP